MDDRLERAIDAALDDVRAVTPAPDFLPRLRAHVEQQPRRAPIRWWIPFAASATTVAAGAIVAWLVRAPAVVAPLALGKPASTAAVAPPPAAPPAVIASEPRAVMPHARRSRTVDRAAEVSEALEILVPAGQRDAIGRLVESFNAGDRDAAALLKKAASRARDADLTIAPIEIAPVVVAPLKESP